MSENDTPTTEEQPLIEVTLDQERTTKGTVKFQAPFKDTAAITDLYVRKTGLAAPYPERIRVVVYAVN